MATTRRGMLVFFISAATGLPLACGRVDTDEASERPRTAAERPAATGSSEKGAPSGIRFTDVTEETGMEFRVTSGESPSTQILEVKGGGLALIDHDGDGDLDVFIPNGATLNNTERGPGCRLFENLGSLRFRDVTESLKLALRRWSYGVAVGDYDGDGFDDMYVACYGKNVLLRNAGGKGFVDATDAAEVGNGQQWSAACAFGDIDRDGDLDLYVVNYLRFDVNRPPRRSLYMGFEVLAGPMGLTATHDALYENLGDGVFVDILEESGSSRVSPSYGLNVAILDFDGDGLQDIFVANDSRPNFLFRNRGQALFKNIGLSSGVALNGDGLPQATMGVAIADVDGNGLPDIFSTNFSSDSNTLHLNLDGETFSDRTKLYGLNVAGWVCVGWACGFFDFDHDGDEDLLLFNGHVYPEATDGKLDAPYEQPPVLFARAASRFVRVGARTAGAWLSRGYVARSAVFGDLDGDGDIDVVFSEVNGPLRVLRNDAGAESPDGWLIVELRDERPNSRNRRGLGSRVELSTAGRKQTRWIYGGGSYQSSNAQYAHFAGMKGVDSASLAVTWPDGFEQRSTSVPLRQHLVVRYGR